MQNNAITLASTLRCHHVIEQRIYEHDSPLLQLGIEEPEGGIDAALLLAVAGITDPEILNRRTIHDPAEVDLPFFVIYGSIFASEAEISIPGPYKSTKSLRLITQ